MSRFIYGVDFFQRRRFLSNRCAVGVDTLDGKFVGLRKVIALNAHFEGAVEKRRS